MNPIDNVHLAVRFFLQIAIILLFCRLIGMVALRFGQPQVVAENDCQSDAGTIVVSMTVITTLMASPIFERLVGSGTDKPEPDRPRTH